MDLPIIIFIIVYALALCGYFITRVGNNIKYRAINKYILATMYLVLAFVGFSLRHVVNSYHIILMAALFLAWLGDIFLVFSLKMGGDFFLAGNVCFFMYGMCVLYDHGFTFASFWWVILVALGMISTFVILCQKFPKVFKLGSMRWPMTLYLTSIFSHGMMGLALVLLLPGTNFMILGLGSLSFMLSDMILTVDRFIIRNNKWIVRANSLTYFGGLLLIALSLFL